MNTPFEVRREGAKKAVVVIPDLFAQERRDILVELEVADEAANETAPLKESCSLRGISMTSTSCIGILIFAHLSFLLY